jgi:hypothetical protein
MFILHSVTQVKIIKKRNVSRMIASISSEVVSVITVTLSSKLALTISLQSLWSIWDVYSFRLERSGLRQSLTPRCSLKSVGAGMWYREKTI